MELDNQELQLGLPINPPVFAVQIDTGVAQNLCGQGIHRESYSRRQDSDCGVTIMPVTLRRLVVGCSTTVLSSKSPANLFPLVKIKGPVSQSLEPHTSGFQRMASSVQKFPLTQH